VGVVVAPGRFHAGDLVVADIGLDPGETALRSVTRELLARVPRRGPADTKYTAGSVLVVGGSRGLTGAASLAAEAAFRADAGYVAVAAPEESLPVLEVRLLEAVKRPLSEIDDAVEKATALALGPGLGRSEEARALVERLLRDSDLPAVVDADALHELKPIGRSAPTVLTPHSGELGRLLGEDSSWVDANRLKAAQRGADRFGDVLTGIVGAFLAKRLEARIAAAAAVAAQQVASTLVPNRAGMVAGDVVAALPRALDATV
jgi:NAD(P)H-hydrate repair Nnr-like enzyme with NAD(P)H-hydrate dehydratase domain